MVLNPIVLFITFAILSVIACGIGINIIRFIENDYTIPLEGCMLEATLIGHIPLTLIICIILYLIQN